MEDFLASIKVDEGIKNGTRICVKNYASLHLGILGIFANKLESSDSTMTEIIGRNLHNHLIGVIGFRPDIFFREKDKYNTVIGPFALNPQQATKQAAKTAQTICSAIITFNS